MSARPACGPRTLRLRRTAIFFSDGDPHTLKLTVNRQTGENMYTRDVSISAHPSWSLARGTWATFPIQNSLNSGRYALDLMIDDPGRPAPIRSSLSRRPNQHRSGERVLAAVLDVQCPSRLPQRFQYVTRTAGRSGAAPTVRSGHSDGRLPSARNGASTTISGAATVTGSGLLCPALRHEQLADIRVPPVAKSALGKEQLQLTTPISTSTVRDDRDGPVPHLISPDAVVEIYLVPRNDDEPLLGERGAYCIRVSLRRLRLRHGPELPEHPGEVALSLPFFADRSTHVSD